MKKFFKEFKEFINRGNVIDLAVGVIIGAAFKAIVDALVNNIINPLLGLIINTDLAEAVWQITPEVAVGYGAFISAIINFFIMALVLLIMIKAVNKLTHLKKKEEPAPAEPTTKVCPFCKSEIAIDATRCPHCTSQLEE